MIFDEFRVFSPEQLGIQDLALRVLPAVTWLAVYRWLHMTRRASSVCLHSESNTGAGLIGWPIPIIHCPAWRDFVQLVLAILLVDLDEKLGNTRYMYDLNFCKVSLLSVHLALRFSYFKPRFDVTIS